MILCMIFLGYAVLSSGLKASCPMTGTAISKQSKLLASNLNQDHSTSISVHNKLTKKYVSLFLSSLLLIGPPTSMMLSSPTIVHAEGFNFFSSQEQRAVDEIADYRRPIRSLLDDLRPSNVPNPVGVYMKQQILKGGKEDSDVVLTNMEVYIKPMQIKMQSFVTSASRPLLDEASESRLKILPSLMKGHILELEQAIKSLKAENQEKEVVEILDTLDEYLALLSSSSKLVVTPFIPLKPLNDAQLFGPLGCEFYGKVRVTGSNACMVKE